MKEEIKIQNDEQLREVDSEIRKTRKRISSIKIKYEEYFSDEEEVSKKGNWVKVV